MSKKKKEIKKKDQRNRDTELSAEDRLKRKKLPPREKDKYQNPRNWLLLEEEDYA